MWRAVLETRGALSALADSKRIVRAPDHVGHRSESKEGVRALVIWPPGKEVSGLEAKAIECASSRGFGLDIAFAKRQFFVST